MLTEPDVAAIAREAMMVALKLGGPPLMIGLTVGLIVSLLQAVTQVTEATLAFVPKVIALCAAFVLLGPFMWATLSDYARSLFDQVIAVGLS